MAKKVTISSNLSGIHDLKAQGNIPHPITSPFVRLHQLQKNRERFFKEEARLLRRLDQLSIQVPAIEEEMERLFKMTGEEIQLGTGKEGTKKAKVKEKTEVSSKKTMLEY